MEEQKKYYLGLDVGTDSVGFCVTDRDYNIVKKHKVIQYDDHSDYYGNHLWGSRLFDEANDAKARRLAREGRRRYQRRRWRIILLQSLFKPEMDKVDVNFFDRLNNSAIHMEDREERLRSTYLLFNGNYTDKVFYKNYPTIYHLRLNMIEHPEIKFDLREVYLALAHMIKYRGNFLTEGELNSIGNDSNTVKDLFDSLDSTILSLMEDDGNALLQTFSCTDAIAKGLIEVFKQKTKKGEIYDAIISQFKFTGLKSNSFNALVIKLISGSTVTVGSLFQDVEADPEILKKKIDFASETFMDDELPNIASAIGEERNSIIVQIKQIYDLRILCHLLSGKKYVSQAMVEIYEKHQKQLKELKKLMKHYNPSKYDAFFKELNNSNNYPRYIGFSKIHGKIVRTDKKCSADDLYKEIKKLLPLDSFNNVGFSFVEESDKDLFLDIQKAMDEQSLFLKQNSKENGVLPYQLNLMEMREILKNQGQYYPFLLEMDKDFNNPEKQSYKIESILKFKIPYYVGPLSNDEDCKKWVCKKTDNVKITPWNFYDVVDTDKTAEAFMENLKNYCTYLLNEPTLAKNSLYYSMYILLNEMNKWYINEEPIKLEDKEYIIKEVYFKDKRPSKTKILDALKKKYGQSVSLSSKKQMLDETKGIQEEDFHATLSSWVDMLDPRGFGERLLHEPNLIDEADEIIYMIAMFEDKTLVKKRLEKMHLTPSQRDYFMKLKYEGWGKLSKKVLCEIKEEKVNQKTGEVMEYSILDEMWNTNSNFMELFESAGSVFKKKVEELNASMQDTPEDIIEQEYVSPMMKRALRQTMKIVEELKRVLKIDSFDTYFVESTRSDSEKQRTKSRKKKLLEILAKAKEFKADMEQDAFKKRIENLTKEIDSKSDDQLKGKSLYLYFMQLGRSVYTGEEISLDDLSKEYDVDHIIPQSKVKDDSFINTVLVEKSVNNKKQDIYPIPKDVLTDKGKAWIRTLNAISKDLMPNDKMNRLLRSINKSLTNDELSGFVKRQLVSTNQSVKAICDVLKVIEPNSKVVYSKANAVSEFRAMFGLTKSRDLNDCHHAHDAYLNIVVGNVYNKVFSTGSANTIKYRIEHYESFHMDPKYIFMHDQRVCLKDTLIWKAKRYDDEGNEITDSQGTIDKVRKYLSYHDVLVTRMMITNVGKQGFFNKCSIHPASAKDASYPLKGSGTFAKEGFEAKYGGYSDLTNPYASLVKSDGKKGAVIYSLEYIPTIVRKTIGDNKQALEEYLVKNNGLKNPQILIEKLLKYTIVSIPYGKGTIRLGISGKSSSSIISINQTQCFMPDKYVKIVKKISNLLGTNLSAGQKKDITVFDKYGNNDIHLNKKNDISRAECEELFDYLVTSVFTKPEFEGLPAVGNTLKKFADKKNDFMALSTINMAKALSCMIKSISCKSVRGIDLRFISENLPSAFGIIMFSKNLVPGTKIIQTSTTGLFEKVLFVVPEK